MRLPTGSSVGRAFECPGSCVLPRAGHQGEGAVYGKDQHAEIEAGDMSRPVVRRVLDGATDVRHEVAYALDVATRSVRELGVGLARGYGELAETEIALTIDVECQRDGAWWVGDWKSRSRVAHVAQNWQVRCAVIAVMARHRTDAVTGFLGYLDDSELESEPFDAFHVATWWAELGDLLDRIRRAANDLARGVVNVSAGSWCHYCPSLPYCPSHTRLAKSMLGELDGVESVLDSLSLEQCGRAWELLKRYDTLADRVRETIRARAKREPVPLSNGRRLALVECSRRSLDTKKAAEMLGDSAPYKTSSYVQVKEMKIKEEVSDG